MLRRLVVTLLLVLTPALLYAQSSSKELRAKRQKIEREIELLQRSLNSAARNKKLTAGQIADLSRQIQLRQEKISVINNEIGALNSEIKTNTNTVTKLKGDLATLKLQYAAMIRFAQRNANAYDKMMFVFGADNFNQAMKRAKYLQQIGKFRQNQAAKIEGTEHQINNKISELDRTRKEKNMLLSDQQNEKKKLDRDRQDKEQKANAYAKQEKKYKGDIAQRRKVARQLDGQIRVAINREIEIARRKAEEEERRRRAIAEAEARARAAREAAAAKAAGNAAKTTTAPAAAAVTKAPAKTNADVLRATPESARLSAGFENNRGSLPYPVANGSITEGFGTHKVDQASYTNDGVTFTTPAGAAVRAVFEGEVSAVGNNMGRYFVLLKHGEYFTIYSNLASVSVSRGQKVGTRQNIGTVAGNDGTGTLEFKISRVTTYLNPQAWLAR